MFEDKLAVGTAQSLLELDGRILQLGGRHLPKRPHELLDFPTLKPAQLARNDDKAKLLATIYRAALSRRLGVEAFAYSNWLAPATRATFDATGVELLKSKIEPVVWCEARMEFYASVVRQDPKAIATGPFVWHKNGLKVTESFWRYWLENQDSFRVPWRPVPVEVADLIRRYNAMWAELRLYVQDGLATAAGLGTVVDRYWPDTAYEKDLSRAKLFLLQVARTPGWEPAKR